MNGERMHRTGQFDGQDLVHGAMPLYPAFAFKRRRHNINTEMGFAFRPRPGMAGMQAGFIDNLKALRCKRFGQPFFNTIFNTHRLRSCVCVMRAS